MPSEKQNWDPKEVFVNKRYKSKEVWVDSKGKKFEAGVHFYVGGNTKMYGASLPRLREKDFEELKHLEGTNGLYEARIKLASNIWRVFCFFDKGKLVVLANGFQKKTQKTPKKEIDIALKLKNKYFNSKKK